MSPVIERLYDSEFMAEAVEYACKSLSSVGPGVAIFEFGDDGGEVGRVFVSAAICEAFAEKRIPKAQRPKSVCCFPRATKPCPGSAVCLKLSVTVVRSESVSLS